MEIYQINSATSAQKEYMIENQNVRIIQCQTNFKLKQFSETVKLI